MKILTQIERAILQWFKGVPHLPANAQKWLGTNVWWIAAAGAVLSGLAILGFLGVLFSGLSALGSPFVSYYASKTFVVWSIITSLVSLVFVALMCLVLAFSVTPLREKQKKGWVLLFGAWLIGAVSIAVTAILTLNVFSFITDIIFGALVVAVSGYFVFEIHNQFAHVTRSKGVKAEEAKKEKK